eukprot:CAMPEP_0196572266 /NCGR_PEP_ID=MMETSP1081-20130531/2344_1 /TAXON_ID=36882 /ORGANISM="Pyramimonas amylifera, Strain CCMP720" /LENGTH=515 /DNA_ID=CAMNT_0041889525 /DNA_START=412 /DNA_END=1959 /DNA_ORIENTATION=+
MGGLSKAQAEEASEGPGTTAEQIVNWSGTHTCHPKKYHQPESLEELERLLAEAHKTGQKLRPIGSALSPNGLGFSDEALVSLALMDQVLSVDKVKCQVTVQAGARVCQVTEALEQHGLVLQNFASIAEQQIGGFTQVGAHGTGARLPPVDQQVVAMKLVTPKQGTVELSLEKEPELFQLAKVGLGSLGVVAEVTLQCVPAHQLVEVTKVVTRDYIASHYQDLIRDNRHCRFMWIPFTKDVVVVTCNLIPEGENAETLTCPPPLSEFDQLAPLRELLLEVGGAKFKSEETTDLNFAQLRDALLSMDPLNVNHIRRVNAAEAVFWRNHQGSRVDWSPRVLGFECGGEQWVSEVAFPAGSVHSPSPASLSFMTSLLALIETENVPAPAPLEQRWSCGSDAPLSLASARGEAPVGGAQAALHCWVGIIMYLPTSDSVQRAKITQEFNQYKRMCSEQIWEKYDAFEHWAKIEMHEDKHSAQNLTERLALRFPLFLLNTAREYFDPKRVLSNKIIDSIFQD